jgi:hypothetical protein
MGRNPNSDMWFLFDRHIAKHIADYETIDNYLYNLPHDLRVYFITGSELSELSERSRIVYWTVQLAHFPFGKI